MARYGVIEHIHNTDFHNDRHDWFGAPCEIISTRGNHVQDPNYIAATLRILKPYDGEDVNIFFAVKIREVDFLEVCKILVTNSKGA